MFNEPEQSLPASTGQKIKQVIYLGDRPNLGAKLVLDPVERKPVVIGDQVDGDAEMAEATRTADPMQVRLRHLGKIEVNHHVHGLYVDTASEQVGANQITTEARSEIVEYPVPVGLRHFGVDVVAAVTQLGDLLR